MICFFLKVPRCRWAFISFAWPKETEPKKRPPLSPVFQKLNYVVAWAKTRYAQTLAHLIHQTVYFLAAIKWEIRIRLQVPFIFTKVPMDALMRSRAPEGLNEILRCLSVASCIVFHSVLRSGGNPLGQAWAGLF